MPDPLSRESWRRLDAIGWASCSGDPERPCWHHPYADINDPFTTEQALEYSTGRETRMFMCAEGSGPDWSGYGDEYDKRRLSVDAIHSRVVEAREAQGFRGDMAAAARRAVEKYADALRLLSDG